jgi:hypothetical protein
MIDTLGPYLLILIFSSSMSAKGGLAIQEMDDEASCRAALVQLQPSRELSGYCIAKNVKQ